MKFYGQFDPPMDRVLYETCFPRRPGKGVFLECGALDGIKNSNCLMFEKTFGWRGTNVEPVPHLFERLVKNRPEALNLPFALSGSYAFTEMLFPSHPVHGEIFGNASLKHSGEHFRALEAEGCAFRPIMVPTVPFGHLGNFMDLNRIDLFSLDVEGHEAPVLRSMFETPCRPTVLCVEIDHNAPGAIGELLQSFGYEIVLTHFANVIARRR